MSLANVVIATREIKFVGGEFTVRGLTMSALTRVVTDGHRDDLDQAVDMLREASGDNFDGASKSDIVGALGVILHQLPTMVAKIIASSANEYAMWPKVMELSVPVQLEALVEIGNLTFDGEASVKKFIGLLIDLMISMRSSVTPALQAATDKMAGMNLSA